MKRNGSLGSRQSRCPQLWLSCLTSGLRRPSDPLAMLACPGFSAFALGMSWVASLLSLLAKHMESSHDKLRKIHTSRYPGGTSLLRPGCFDGEGLQTH